MLFTSFAFIFAFLPVVFVGFFVLARIHRGTAAAWLAGASVFFYGWWDVQYVPLLLGSIVLNYTAGYVIARLRDRSPWAKRFLVGSIVANLALLAYYKYANFFLAEIVAPLGGHPPVLNVVLPIGISFFTFTQIAFLVDAWKGKAREYNFVHYLLFVTWFPHLIAGPVLHHGQMMPQLRNPAVYRVRSRNLAIGLVLFTIGISKKLLIADPISVYADPIFTAAASGNAVGFVGGWVGALAYTFQIYFDFSGYSDMAVGLSMLFGVQLPINFNSPYKSVNIIDFWRRWHMTLSQFLRDYLYIPLGGNKHGQIWRYFNLMATMVLGGLWHGANWTFIVWGGLHGAFLCANHAFQWVSRKLGIAGCAPGWLTAPLGVLLTFFMVVIAWVYFRAPNLAAANSIVAAMAGIATPAEWPDVLNEQSALVFIAYLMLSAMIVWLCPNAYELADLVENRIKLEGAGGRRLGAMLCISGAAVCVLLFAASLATTFGTNVNSPFLYFQF